MRVAFFVLPGAMAENEALAPENEYVSARCTTLQGNEQMLSFPRGAALGAFFLNNHIKKAKEQEKQTDSARKRATGEMQEQLCAAFSTQWSLTAGCNAHMRHMTYAAHSICGAYMRDTSGICRLWLNNSTTRHVNEKRWHVAVSLAQPSPLQGGALWGNLAGHGDALACRGQPSAA